MLPKVEPVVRPKKVELAIPTVQATPDQVEWLAARVAVLSALTEDQCRFEAETTARNEEFWDWHGGSWVDCKRETCTKCQSKKGMRLWKAQYGPDDKATVARDRRQEVYNEIDRMVLTILIDAGIELQVDRSGQILNELRGIAAVVAAPHTFLLTGSFAFFEDSGFSKGLLEREIVIL